MPFRSLWNRLLGKDDSNSLEHRRDDLHDILADHVNEIVDFTLKAQRFLGDDLTGGGVAPGMAYQQDTPDMTLKVIGGTFNVGGTKVEKMAGPYTTGTFAADATNPRISLLSIDSGGDFNITAGTPAGSPVAPDDPVGEVVLWEVYIKANATALYEVDPQTTLTGYLYRDRRYPPGGGGSGSVGGGGIAYLGAEPPAEDTIAEQLTTGTGTSISVTTAGTGIRIPSRITCFNDSGNVAGTATITLDSGEGANWDCTLFSGAVSGETFALEPRSERERLAWMALSGDQWLISFSMGSSSHIAVTVEYWEVTGLVDHSIVENIDDFGDSMYYPYTGTPGTADLTGPAFYYLGFTCRIEATDTADILQNFHNIDYPIETISFASKQYIVGWMPETWKVAVGANNTLRIERDGAFGNDDWYFRILILAES